MPEPIELPVTLEPLTGAKAIQFARWIKSKVPGLSGARVMVPLILNRDDHVHTIVHVRTDHVRAVLEHDDA